MNEKGALRCFKLGAHVIEMEKGALIRRETNTCKKTKGARVKVKETIIRGENGALLASEKGHSPVMKKGHLLDFNRGIWQK